MKPEEITKNAIAELEAGNVYVGEFGQEIIERAVREAVEQQKRADIRVVKVYTRYYGNEKADRIADEIKERGSYITDEMYAEYEAGEK